MLIALNRAYWDKFEFPPKEECEKTDIYENCGSEVGTRKPRWLGCEYCLVVTKGPLVQALPRMIIWRGAEAPNNDIDLRDMS